MKKVIVKIVMGLFMCIAALNMNSKKGIEAKAEVKSEYMQNVPLDAVSFPDEMFREKLKIYVDENKDGILSRDERGKIYYLYLNNCPNGVWETWYQDMECTYADKEEDYLVRDKTKCALNLDFNYDEKNPQRALADHTIDVRGIEYFFNLQEVRINKYELLTGSFKNNANLKKIWVGCSKKGQKGYGNIKADFPVSQLAYMHLENITADTLNVEEIPNLQILRVILPEGSNQRLTAFNLSKNTKLKELELANIIPGKLDLRKNRKIESVKVYSGKGKRGKNYYYYLPEKNQKCKIVFPKKNQVRTFWYFTADKSIDLTRLTKLEDFHTLKSVKAKAKSSWIRKTFTKKKWGCAIVKSGKFIKKIKANKKKKFTMI